METPKISGMVIDFAGDYLSLGKTPAERTNLLWSACSAWNLACAPEESRAGFLDQFLANYRGCNPGSEAEELKGVRQDMELLIQNKLKKYPAVITTIVSCQLVEAEGKERVLVTAFTPSRRSSAPPPVLGSISTGAVG